MTAATLVENLTQRHKERELSALNAFHEVCDRLARDESVDVNTVEGIIQEAGKWPEELIEEVASRKHLAECKRTASQLPEIEQELATLEERYQTSKSNSVAAIEQAEREAEANLSRLRKNLEDVDKLYRVNRGVLDRKYNDANAARSEVLSHIPPAFADRRNLLIERLSHARSELREAGEAIPNGKEVIKRAKNVEHDCSERLRVHGIYSRPELNGAAAAEIQSLKDEIARAKNERTAADERILIAEKAIPRLTKQVADLEVQLAKLDREIVIS